MKLIDRDIKKKKINQYKLGPEDISNKPKIKKCKVTTYSLYLPNEKLVQPNKVLIAKDCFKLLSIPTTRVTKVVATSIEKLFGGNNLIFKMTIFPLIYI